MQKQITLYRDARGSSPFCHRVEIALAEAGASYTLYGFDVYSKPAWFAQVNPVTGKIPAITYGGPDVPPEEPSPHSFKLTESHVILEFLADLFPDSGLLPSTSDPTARARVRLFMDIVARVFDIAMFDIPRRIPGAFEKLVEGLEKIQGLLPNQDGPEGGAYAVGKAFTNADCAIAPLLATMEVTIRTDLGRFEPGTGKKLGELLAGGRFDRLRTYTKVLLERESVKKVIDLERMEAAQRARYARE